MVVLSDVPLYKCSKSESDDGREQAGPAGGQLANVVQLGVK